MLQTTHVANVAGAGVQGARDGSEKLDTIINTATRTGGDKSNNEIMRLMLIQFSSQNNERPGEFLDIPHSESYHYQRNEDVLNAPLRILPLENNKVPQCPSIQRFDKIQHPVFCNEDKAVVLASHTPNAAATNTKNAASEKIRSIKAM